MMLRPEQSQISPVDSGNRDDARWQVEQLDFEGFSSLITIRAIRATSADAPRSLTVRGLSGPVRWRFSSSIKRLAERRPGPPSARGHAVSAARGTASGDE
jgi:hypothetical protein